MYFEQVTLIVSLLSTFRDLRRNNLKWIGITFELKSKLSLPTKMNKVLLNRNTK